MASMVATQVKPVTRSVTRLIEAGSMVYCMHCEKQVKFRARQRDQQVICNVYEDGRWDRVEHFHDACYTDAGQPHGDSADRTRPAGPVSS